MSARLYRRKSVESSEPDKLHGTPAWQYENGEWAELIFDGPTQAYITLKEYRRLEELRAEQRKAAYLHNGGFPRQNQCKLNRQQERFLRIAPTHAWPCA